jgi:predicted nuclease of predicted toxin-antitoxin system
MNAKKNLITSDPAIMMGKPVVAGTRIIAEMAPGIADDEVLEIANERGALLLTSDKDFGELVYRQRQLTSGVILIRVAGLSPTRKAEIVTSAIGQHSEELPNAFSVVTPATVRIRRAKD